MGFQKTTADLFCCFFNFGGSNYSSKDELEGRDQGHDIKDSIHKRLYKKWCLLIHNIQFVIYFRRCQGWRLMSSAAQRSWQRETKGRYSYFLFFCLIYLIIERKFKHILMIVSVFFRGVVAILPRARDWGSLHPPEGDQQDGEGNSKGTIML